MNSRGVVCKKAGRHRWEITAFDMAFANREPGDVSETGDDPKSNYHLQHGLATAVERMLCAALGISWKEIRAKRF